MQQQSSKVKNPETPIQKNPTMNDRDFLNDILSTEKYLTQAYSIALNEASNQTLYQDVLQIFEETQNCQRDLYNTMFKHGWYGLEKEEQQKIQQSFQQFQQYKNQLPVH